MNDFLYLLYLSKWFLLIGYKYDGQGKLQNTITTVMGYCVVRWKGYNSWFMCGPSKEGKEDENRSLLNWEWISLISYPLSGNASPSCTATTVDFHGVFKCWKPIMCSYELDDVGQECSAIFGIQPKIRSAQLSHLSQPPYFCQHLLDNVQRLTEMTGEQF